MRYVYLVYRVIYDSYEILEHVVDSEEKAKEKVLELAKESTFAPYYQKTRLE